MARGKYASSADARQHRETAEKRAQDAEKAIERLEAKLARAEKENIEQQAFYASNVTRLRAMVAANTSDEMSALQAANQAISDERDVALAHVDDIEKRWQKVSQKIIDHFKSDFGDESAGAGEYAVQMFLDMFLQEPGKSLVLHGDEERIAKKHGTAAVAAMRRARRGAGDPMRLDYVIRPSAEGDGRQEPAGARE